VQLTNTNRSALFSFSSSSSSSYHASSIDDYGKTSGKQQWGRVYLKSGVHSIHCNGGQGEKFCDMQTVGNGSCDGRRREVLLPS
jgi:hypothetical protein